MLFRSGDRIHDPTPRLARFRRLRDGDPERGRTIRSRTLVAEGVADRPLSSPAGGMHYLEASDSEPSGREIPRARPVCREVVSFVRFGRVGSASRQLLRSLIEHANDVNLLAANAIVDCERSSRGDRTPDSRSFRGMPRLGIGPKQRHAGR